MNQRKPVVKHRVCLWGRSDSSLKSNQSVRQTHLHSWKQRMQIWQMCSNDRQEVSPKQGACDSTAAFCYRPRMHSQLSCSVVLLQRDYYRLDFSIFSFSLPHSSTGRKVSGECAQAWWSFLLSLKNKMKQMASVLSYLTSDGDGVGKPWFCENTPFH